MHKGSGQTLTVIDGAGVTRTYSGRLGWALRCLIAVGGRGCTPIDTPGPRWSDYVFKLRREGLDIETIIEAHGPPFSGTHARYVLRTPLRILSGQAA